ncbi:hypothetical protein CW368_02255 [Actinomycetales bacterium SN12]|nr:hypothetical protein CW368_02255 [Actinomycetales bacterium SN12]
MSHPTNRRRHRRTPEETQARNARSVKMLISARSLPEPARRRVHQRVVLEYLDVADAVASRYQSSAQDSRDLRQVAYLGLTKAVQRFEPTLGVDIVSFAVPTISGEIKRYLRDSSWVVRPPRQLQELSVELRSEVPRIAQSLGREPSLEEVAEELDLPVERVAEAMACAQGRRPVSLDTPQRGDWTEGLALGDTLRAGHDDFARAELSVAVERACATLTPRERKIIHLRFVREYTQSEIARECGVTQMQISRLLTKIMTTLRSHLSPELLAA